MGIYSAERCHGKHRHRWSAGVLRNGRGVAAMCVPTRPPVRPELNPPQVYGGLGPRPGSVQQLRHSPSILAERNHKRNHIVRNLNDSLPKTLLVFSTAIFGLHKTADCHDYLLLPDNTVLASRHWMWITQRPSDAGPLSGVLILHGGRSGWRCFAPWRWTWGRSLPHPPLSSHTRRFICKRGWRCCRGLGSTRPRSCGAARRCFLTATIASVTRSHSWTVRGWMASGLSTALRWYCAAA